MLALETRQRMFRKGNESQRRKGAEIASNSLQTHLCYPSHLIFFSMQQNQNFPGFVAWNWGQLKITIMAAACIPTKTSSFYKVIIMKLPWLTHPFPSFTCQHDISEFCKKGQGASQSSNPTQTPSLMNIQLTPTQEAITYAFIPDRDETKTQWILLSLLELLGCAILHYMQVDLASLLTFTSISCLNSLLN